MERGGGSGGILDGGLDRGPSIHGGEMCVRVPLLQMGDVLLLMRGPTARCVRSGGTIELGVFFFLFCYYCDLLFPSPPSSSLLSASAWPLEMTSLQAWEMTARGPAAARPGQAKPSGARYGVAVVVGRELVDVQERDGDGLDLDTCTYMGPAPRNRERRSMARYRQGEPQSRKCLDAG